MQSNNITQLDQAMEDEIVDEATGAAAEGEMDGEAQELDQAAVRAARRSAMDGIGILMTQRLQEAITFRGPFEMEWVADMRQYENGDPDANEQSETKQYSSTGEEYKSASDNITRPAVLTYASRLGDMLFPTNDRNWDIDSTPEPELPDDVLAELDRRMAENGLPPDERDALIREIANKRMGKMRRQMDDQLTESHYNAHGRNAILEACQLGTGVMRGPFAKTSKRRRYSAKSGFKSEIVEDKTSPRVEKRDLWNIFPLPCRRIEDCPGVFELHEMTGKKLADLRNQPGFSAEQVGRALKQPPSWTTFGTSVVGMRRFLDKNTGIRQDEVYPVVSYDGEMPADALLVFVEQLLFENKIGEDQKVEILNAVKESNAVHVNCSVWMCNNIVLKVAISPIDHCSQMYKFFTIEERSDGPFGRSITSLLRDPQRNVRMLWSTILLNAMMSSGVQIAVRKGALVPFGPNGQSNDFRFTRPRVWAFNDDIEDVNKAFQTFVVPNNLAALLPVYERAKKNAEEQVMLPLIAQGEPTQAVPTSSGLAMLMNAANIVQRRVAMRWDDNVTTPMISDFYEWNMTYGPDEAKGDYKVNARASSHLLVKDIQAQHLLNALSLFQSNPMFAGRLKEQAWAEGIMRVMDLDSTTYLLSEEEYEAKQAEAAKNPQPDADTMRAEAALKMADARTMEAETNSAFKQGQLALQDAESQRRFEAGIADRESRERQAAMTLQGVLAQFDGEAQLRIREMAADMEKNIQSESEETRREGMRIAAKAQDKAIDIERDKFEAKVEANTSPGPRLA